MLNIVEIYYLMAFKKSAERQKNNYLTITFVVLFIKLTIDKNRTSNEELDSKLNGVDYVHYYVLFTQ